MTDALCLSDAVWEASGPDISCTGYLPASGGLLSLYRRLLQN